MSYKHVPSDALQGREERSSGEDAREYLVASNLGNGRWSMVTLPSVEIVNQSELDIPPDYLEVEPWYCWMPFVGVKYYPTGTDRRP